MKKCPAFVFIFICWQCFSQTLKNTGTSISLSDGVKMSVKMDLLNSGKLINNGKIYLAGDWTNNGIYGDQNGELIFTGVGNQVIKHVVFGFRNLMVEGGGRIVVADDIEITENLQLNEGYVQVTDGMKFVVSNDAQITGASSNSYIIGELFRKGTGDLSFPIGTESEFLPTSIKGVKGKNPLVGLKVNPTASMLPRGADVMEVVDSIHWIITVDNNYEGGYAELPYSSDRLIADFEKLVVLEGNTEIESLGSSQVIGDATSGKVTSAEESFGPFLMLGYERTELPPLEVINALTPNQDGKHDFLRIENINFYEENTVDIFDRNGLKVFSIEGYNNLDRVFTGSANQGSGGELAEGTYFYTIRNGREAIASGFLILTR